MQRKLATYNIIYHRDFDGACSAAVFIEFALRKGLIVDETDTTLLPVEYDLQKKWVDYDLPPNSVILDFLFHPKAAWWFDHHPTTFLRSDWERSFKEDLHHHWNTSYKSCPQLIIDSIEESEIRNELTTTFREHIFWSDIIDTANYDSARQVVAAEDPAIRINLSIDVKPDPEYLNFLVSALRTHSIARVSELDVVKSRSRAALRWQRRAIEYISEVAEVRKDVAFVDITRRRKLFHRYAAYYLWPDLRFVVSVYGVGTHYKVSIGANPWRDFDGPNIGLLCEKYGGGGHEPVGGIITDNLRKAKRIAREITEILRKERGYTEQLPFRAIAGRRE